MFIADSMTPEPVTVSADISIADAVDLLKKHHFRHLPVVDGENRLLGMVTDRDLRSACPSTVLDQDARDQVLARVGSATVGEIMSRDFVSLSPYSTLDDALLLFKTRAIGALPVLDRKGRVVGIFSLNDMMAAYRRLFGLGEKGSVLIAIEEQSGQPPLGDLVHALERENITFTRLLRVAGQGEKSGMMYLRVNTMNIRRAHRVIEKAGFHIHVPHSSGTRSPQSM
jgi:acetoin utilization protein AcuB